MSSKFKLLLIFLFFVLTGCSGDGGNWGWYVIDPTTKSGWINIKFLIGGFGSTIQLSLIAAFLSIAIGLIVALPGMSKNPFLRAINCLYLYYFRTDSCTAQFIQ